MDDTATPAAKRKTRTNTDKKALKKPQAESPGAVGRETRDAILRAATTVFSKYGYDAGSLDKISKAAKSVDRMIYYYFGSKEGLFIAVLDDMYRRMGEAELRLGLDMQDPVKSFEKVIRFVFQYYRRHPELIVLLNSENMHRGRHLARSPRVRESGEAFASPTLSAVAQLLESGQEQGIFRGGLRARDVYLMILASGYFYVSNRYTLSRFLGESLDTDEAQHDWENFVVDTMLRAVAA